jgi:hypothetical protein
MMGMAPMKFYRPLGVGTQTVWWNLYSGHVGQKDLFMENGFAILVVGATREEAA